MTSAELMPVIAKLKDAIAEYRYVGIQPEGVDPTETPCFALATDTLPDDVRKADTAIALRMGAAAALARDTWPNTDGKPRGWQFVAGNLIHTLHSSREIPDGALWLTKPVIIATIGSI